MNNRRTMSKDDKWKYFKYKSGNDYSKYIALFSIAFALVLWGIYKKCSVSFLGTFALVLLIVGTIAIVYSLVIHLMYLMIFFENKEVVDGHIFKTHRRREFSQDSDASIYANRARAISEDGNISTPWQYCSKKLLKDNNKPVTIILLNNRGIEFYY